MHTRCVAAAASGFKRRGPVEGSEREGVGKRKGKRKREKERERKKKRERGGGRKSNEASTAQDCEFSTLSEQKPKKNLAPALTRRGARDFGFAKARVNQSNGQVTFSGVLPPWVSGCGCEAD